MSSEFNTNKKTNRLSAKEASQVYIINQEGESQEKKIPRTL